MAGGYFISAAPIPPPLRAYLVLHLYQQSQMLILQCTIDEINTCVYATRMSQVRTTDSATMQGMGRPRKSDEVPLFVQKLKALMKGRVNTVIEDEAGVRRGTISTCFARNCVAIPFTALKLARALKVDFEWLVDEDNSSLVPPTPKTAALVRRELSERQLQEIPHDELLRELARRFCKAVIHMHQQLDDADRVPWEAAAIEAWSVGPGKPLRDAAKRIADASDALDVTVRSLETACNVQFWVLMNSHEIPEAQNFETEDLSTGSVNMRWLELKRQRPGLTALLRLRDFARLEPELIEPEEMEWMRGYEVPVILAHLVTHGSVADVVSKVPMFAQARADLERQGYIGKDGKPTRPLPWEATAEQLRQMRDEFQKRRKRK